MATLSHSCDFSLAELLAELLARLRALHGEQALPPARGPFELVLWENACYLLPEERRAEVFQGLREQVGLSSQALWNAPDDVLLALARRGACGLKPASYGGGKLPASRRNNSPAT